MGLAPIFRAVVVLAGVLVSGGAVADPWRPWAAQDSLSVRLQHPDAAVRRAALWALSLRSFVHGSATAARLATQVASVAWRDRDLGAASAAVFVLSRMGTPEARASLREIAAAPGVPLTVRAAALRSFVLSGELSSAMGLLAVLRAGTLPLEGDGLVAVAERTLADLPDASFAVLVRESNPVQGVSVGRAGVLRAIGFRGDPRWGPVLGEVLRETRHRSAGTLALAALSSVVRLRFVELADAVVALAREDADPTVRRAATRALGALGGGFDPAVLRALLDDPTTREPALEALGALGDMGSISAVVRQLDASWSGDRRAAAEALGAMGAPAAIAPLVARAEREEDLEVRRALWRALAHIGGREARDALARVDDPLARWALVELLARESSLGAPERLQGDDPPSLLLAGLAGALRVEALGAVSPGRRATVSLALGLAPSGDLARVERLGVALAREAHEGVRVAIVQALAELAGREDTDRDARTAAWGMLLELVEREGIELSLAGTAALSALGVLRVAAARPAVLRVVTADVSSSLVRRVALCAAGRLGVRGARLVAARALVSDPDDDVRCAAAVALRAILGEEAEAYLRAASQASGSLAVIDRIAMAASVLGFRGEGSVRASGAEPGSVWTVTLPDGCVAFGVATEDGELWVRGTPETGTGELVRVDQ